MSLLLEHEIEHFVDWLEDKDMRELGEKLYLSKFDVKKLKKRKIGKSWINQAIDGVIQRGHTNAFWRENPVH